MKYPMVGFMGMSWFMNSKRSFFSRIASWMLLTYGENIMNYMDTTFLNLHSNDREDFHCDPIELIEATPGTSLSQAHEDVPTRLVVHLLATVEHIDHDADGPAKILGRLSLTRASGALRRPAHHQMQGLCEGDVAPGQVKTPSPCLTCRSME